MVAASGKHILHFLVNQLRKERMGYFYVAPYGIFLKLSVCIHVIQTCTHNLMFTFIIFPSLRRLLPFQLPLCLGHAQIIRPVLLRRFRPSLADILKGQGRHCSRPLLVEMSRGKGKRNLHQFL